MPDFHILLNYGSSGPFSYHIMNQPSPGILRTQSLSMPSGDFRCCIVGLLRRGTLSLVAPLKTLVARPTPSSAPAVGIHQVDSGCRTKSTVGDSAESHKGAWSG